MKLTPVKLPDNKFLEQIGFFWHTDPDKTPYVASEIVDITPDEADGYYEAVNELYETAGIKFDFSEAYIKQLVDFVKEELENLK